MLKYKTKTLNISVAKCKHYMSLTHTKMKQICDKNKDRKVERTITMQGAIEKSKNSIFGRANDIFTHYGLISSIHITCEQISYFLSFYLS